MPNREQARRSVWFFVNDCLICSDIRPIILDDFDGVLTGSLDRSRFHFALVQKILPIQRIPLRRPEARIADDAA